MGRHVARDVMICDFFVNDKETTEIDTSIFVGSVRGVEETEPKVRDGDMPQFPGTPPIYHG